MGAASGGAIPVVPAEVTGSVGVVIVVVDGACPAAGVSGTATPVVGVAALGVVALGVVALGIGLVCVVGEAGAAGPAGCDGGLDAVSTAVPAAAGVAVDAWVEAEVSPWASVTVSATALTPAAPAIPTVIPRTRRCHLEVRCRPVCPARGVVILRSSNGRRPARVVIET